MIKIGSKQDMRLMRFSPFGAYLTDLDESGTDVLLPKKYLTEESVEGQLIEVFVYKDTKDRLVATTDTPVAEVGELAYLKVVSVGENGAFLDWGLEKDVFLPFKEQSCALEKGQSYLVALYVDKSERIAATMHIGKYLRDDSPYKTGDWATAIVYNVHGSYGAYVAVEQKFLGRIPLKEMMYELHFGQEVSVRVTRVLEDGKLELSLREKSHLQRDEDSDRILNALREAEGTLMLSDSSEPERIKQMLQMSKKSFKKAIGKLYKEGLIELSEDKIILK